jgi:hypothetical protein
LWFAISTATRVVSFVVRSSTASRVVSFVGRGFNRDTTPSEREGLQPLKYVPARAVSKIALKKM